MKKVNRDELRKLEPGLHWVKLTRLYEPTPIVVYEGLAIVFIKIRQKDYKEYKAGTIQTITVLDSEPWAEGGEPNDIDVDGSIVVENYLMEVFS